MLDELECSGRWFLPQCPQERIDGVLKFSPTTGAKLKVRGSFAPEEEVGVTGGRFGIILGVTDNGKYITLYENEWVSSSHRMPGGFAQTFRVGCVLHLPDSLTRRLPEVSHLALEKLFTEVPACQGRSKFGPLRRSKSRPVGEGVAVFVGRLERSLRSPFRAAQA